MSTPIVPSNRPATFLPAKTVSYNPTSAQDPRVAAATSPLPKNRVLSVINSQVPHTSVAPAQAAPLPANPNPLQPGQYGAVANPPGRRPMATAATFQPAYYVNPARSSTFTPNPS